MSVFVESSGDTWLCAGQSNMELKMGSLKYYEPFEFFHEDPLLRQYSAEYGMISAVKGEIEKFSAVGYFFGRRLREQLGIPINIICAAKGGTPIQCWLSPRSAKKFPPSATDTGADTSAFFGALNAADAGFSGGKIRDLGQHFETETPGVTWFRREIDIPAQWDGQSAKIFLGRINDADEVWLDDEKIAETVGCHEPREYIIPAVKSGKHTMTIRVVSFRGDEMFVGGKPRILQCAGRSISLERGWEYNRGADCPRYKSPPGADITPSSMYNSLIAPLKGTRICGVLWYQGESDTGFPELYDEKFMAMVGDFRAIFGEYLPFITTELAYYGERGGWDAIRAKQLKAAESIPGVSLIFSADTGEFNDLHPLNKRQIGERLALAALGARYGKNVDSPYVFIKQEDCSQDAFLNV